MSYDEKALRRTIDCAHVYAAPPEAFPVCSACGATMITHVRMADGTEIRTENMGQASGVFRVRLESRPCCSGKPHCVHCDRARDAFTAWHDRSGTRYFETEVLEDVGPALRAELDKAGLP